MSENMESLRRYFNEIVDILTPTITYTMHQLYITYHSWNSYFFPPEVAMVIELDYSKIDAILVDGNPVAWESHLTTGPSWHPLSGVVASSDDAIEIQYSNLHDKFRYIVQPGENVENICAGIIWCVADKRLKSLILFANYELEDGTEVDITTELNEYTYPTEEEITMDFFEWDKIFHNGNRLSNYTVFFMDWTGKEHKKEPQN